MLINEELYDKIQRYLDQEMSVEEAQAFEGAMAKDEALAREVALNQEMKAMLGESPENELLKNLEMLSSEVEDIPPYSSGTSWRSLLWFIPVLLIIGWLVFSPSDNNTSQESKVEPPIEEPATAPVIEEVPVESPSKEEPQELEREQTKEIITPAPSDKQKKVPPSPPIDKKPKKSQPIAAADFEPNPSLDFLIANNVRNNEITLTIHQKQSNVELKNNGDKTAFKIAGQFESITDLSDKDFKLHMFSNKKADFDNFEPFSTSDLTLQPDTDNIYKVANSQSLDLKPGLYYYLIEDYGTEKIYYVEKFEVRLK